MFKILSIIKFHTDWVLTFLKIFIWVALFFRFSHCINLEFYQDIVNVLSGLLEEGNLGLRERLNCIQTVFVILSGQGSALNIDPHR